MPVYIWSIKVEFSSRDSATGCLTSTSNLDRSVVIHLISSYPVEPYLSVIRVYRHGPARGRRAVTSPSRGGRTSCRRPGTRGGPRPSSGRRARRGFSGAFRSEDGRSRAAWSKEQKRVFHQRKTVSSRPLRERRVTHGAVDTQHYKLQPSIVVEPALAMSGPRWPMSHKYNAPPPRDGRERER